MEQELIKKLNELAKINIPENNTKKDFIDIPAGTYLCKVKDIKETKSKNNKDLLITKFQVIAGEYKNQVFTYIRALPDKQGIANNNKKELYKLGLLNCYLNNLGVMPDEPEQAINKIFFIGVSYNGTFTNVDFINRYNNSFGR